MSHHLLSVSSLRVVIVEELNDFDPQTQGSRVHSVSAFEKSQNCIALGERDALREQG